MNFKNAFHIDKIEYNQREKKSLPKSPYILNNYNYYEPNLAKDFYLYHFVNKLFLEVDVLDLDEFLYYHLNNSENPDYYCRVLELKIAPILKDVLENAEVNFNGRNSREVDLENGFFQIDDVIFKYGYKYSDMCHLVGMYRPKQELYKKLGIVEDFIKINIDKKAQIDKLNWIGESSHLSYIISELVNQNYIEAPMKPDGDNNYSQLSRQIKNSFKQKNNIQIESMRKYASPDNEKFQELDHKFKIEYNFHIPNKKRIS